MLGIMLRLGPRNCEAGLEGRREALVGSSGAPVMPFAAAVMAAMLPAAVELMLFRRVTRCAGLMEPTDSECECGRGLGREPAMLLECRCWLVGRIAMVSCKGQDGQRTIEAGQEGFKGTACLVDGHGAVGQFSTLGVLCSSGQARRLHGCRTKKNNTHRPGDRRLLTSGNVVWVEPSRSGLLWRLYRAAGDWREEWAGWRLAGGFAVHKNMWNVCGPLSDIVLHAGRTVSHAQGLGRAARLSRRGRHTGETRRCSESVRWGAGEMPGGQVGAGGQAGIFIADECTPCLVLVVSGGYGSGGVIGRLVNGQVFEREGERRGIFCSACSVVSVAEELGSGQARAGCYYGRCVCAAATARNATSIPRAPVGRGGLP